MKIRWIHADTGQEAIRRLAASEGPWLHMRSPWHRPEHEPPDSEYLIVAVVASVTEKV